MVHRVGRRIVRSIVLLLVVTFLVFALVDLAPGDLAVRAAGENAPPARVEEVRRELGLNRPLAVRYARWISGAARGDLGRSVSTGRPVADLVGERLAVTASLMAVAVVISTIVGLAMAVVAATCRGRLADRAVTVVSAGLLAAPPFWLGLLLVQGLAVERSLLPALGYVDLTESPVEWLRHLFQPALALAALPAAELALQGRSALVESLTSDHVITARARGLHPAKVVLKHAGKNAAVPVVALFGLRLAQLLGGTAVVETVFVLPGLGRLAVESVLGGDVPVVLAIVLVTTAVVMVVNVAVDASLSYFRPGMT